MTSHFQACAYSSYYRINIETFQNETKTLPNIFQSLIIPYIKLHATETIWAKFLFVLPKSMVTHMSVCTSFNNIFIFHPADLHMAALWANDSSWMQFYSTRMCFVFVVLCKHLFRQYDNTWACHYSHMTQIFKFCLSCFIQLLPSLSTTPLNSATGTATNAIGFGIAESCAFVNQSASISSVHTAASRHSKLHYPSFRVS